MTEVVEKKGLVEFLRETKLETKKVTWPTKHEVTNATMIVVIIMVAFGFLVGGMDALLAYIVKSLLRGL